MYTIIGGDQKEYGPVSADDVRQWIAEGRLGEQSLIKAEGAAEFRALGTFAEFGEAFKSGGAIPNQAQSFADSAGWQAEVTTREPELKLGECLAAGGSFLAANAGFVAGAVFLTWLTNLVFVSISLFVPLLGSIIYLCFKGVIMGGFYVACLRRMRGEAVSPPEVFTGFKTAFFQLLLTGLVSALLAEIGICFCILPAIYLMVAWVFALPLVADKKMFFWSAMELSRKVVTRIWFQVLVLLLIAFLPMVIFQIFNIIQTGDFFMSLYDQANHNWQQVAQNMQNHTDDLHKLALKMTWAGQAALLVNLFYCGGVLMRAYENLFSPRKS